MKRIEIRRELGSDVVTREHGARLRELVLKAWTDPPIIVDFDGLQVTSVSFFDEAFGQLAVQHGEEEFTRRMRLEGLDKFDRALVTDIVASRGREARKRAVP